MRLWHEDMIHNLSREHLLAQHRECCALRGKGWKKKHATVDYIFEYPKNKLCEYHMKVIEEMESRGFHVFQEWKNLHYCGKQLGYSSIDIDKDYKSNDNSYGTIYLEHTPEYFEECLDNLRNKGYSVSKFRLKGE